MVQQCLVRDIKPGIAEIMTVVEHLVKENILHGKICIAFTPDEEVGSGASALDLDAFGAGYAYTIDGGEKAKSPMRISMPVQQNL